MGAAADCWLTCAAVGTASGVSLDELGAGVATEPAGSAWIRMQRRMSQESMTHCWPSEQSSALAQLDVPVPLAHGEDGGLVLLPLQAHASKATATMDDRKVMRAPPSSSIDHRDGKTLELSQQARVGAVALNVRYDTPCTGAQDPC